MTEQYDLVIVGTGPAGAVIARQVHEQAPDASILVLEAGRDITGVRGEHLVEADESAMNASYDDLMRRAREAVLAGAYEDFYEEWMASPAARDY